jgi:hypothetical protein
MNDATGFTGWCRGLIAKHPANVIALLSAMCAAGIKRGTMSANDLVGVRYDDPHVAGAAFKLMKRIGFAKSDRIVASTRPRSHASFVLVWDLVERWKAEQFLSECSAFLTGQERKEETIPRDERGNGLLPL